MNSGRLLNVVALSLLLMAGRGRLFCQAAPVLNHNLVVLDPAHGGPDSGARLSEHLLEKDVTLALANRIRAALSPAGITVGATRDTDTFDLLPDTQRAEAANRSHAVACLVLHATNNGTGVHLYVSQLEAVGAVDYTYAEQSGAHSSYVPTPWEKAQATSISQSLRLASDLGSSLTTSGIPLVEARASVRPIDNLQCPAVAVEIAPLVADGKSTSVADAAYQQRVADAIARALMFWRNHADAPPARGASATPEDWLNALPAHPRAAAGAAPKKTAPKPAATPPDSGGTP